MSSSLISRQEASSLQEYNSINTVLSSVIQHAFTTTHRLLHIVMEGEDGNHYDYYNDTSSSSSIDNNSIHQPRHPFDYNTTTDRNDESSSSSSSSSSTTYSFDPAVFWGVNAFIFVLFATAIVWCCIAARNAHEDLRSENTFTAYFISMFTFSDEQRRQRSDETYRQAVLRRRERRAQAKIDTPEKRTKKLMKSFHKHKVIMTVTEEDLIEDMYHNNNNDNNDDHNDLSSRDIETGSPSLDNDDDDEETGQLKLGNGKLVPNCCAICLSSYEINDVVIWSSNDKCIHAFHQDCVVGWLIKMQPETPCPCCRQEFTDLENQRKEKKVTWSGTNTFDIHALSL